MSEPSIETAQQILFRLHIHLDVCRRLLESSDPIEAQKLLAKARGDVRELAPFFGMRFDPE